MTCRTSKRPRSRLHDLRSSMCMSPAARTHLSGIIVRLPYTTHQCIRCSSPIVLLTRLRLRPRPASSSPNALSATAAVRRCAANGASAAANLKRWRATHALCPFPASKTVSQDATGPVRRPPRFMRPLEISRLSNLQRDALDVLLKFKSRGTRCFRSTVVRHGSVERPITEETSARTSFALTRHTHPICYHHLFAVFASFSSTSSYTSLAAQRWKQKYERPTDWI